MNLEDNAEVTTTSSSEISTSPNFSLPKLIDNLNSNLTLLLVIPPLLGSVFQVISLTSIDISFLRFFSVSQLVPDGTMILIVTSILIGVWWIYSKLLKLSRFNVNDYIDLGGRSFFIRYGIHLVGAFFTVVAYIGSILTTDEIIKIPLLYLIMTGFFYYITIFFMGFFYIQSKTVFNKNSTLICLFINFNKGLICLVLLSILITIFLNLKIIFNLFQLPKNLANYDKVKNTLIKDYPKATNEVEVLYFNDNYTFVKFKQKDRKDSQIIVYKTEEIMLK